MPIDFGAAQQLVETQLGGFLIAHSQQPETLGNEVSYEPVEVPVPVEKAQSSQLTSLSWQYALLLPRWVRRISSPIWSIGVPIEVSRMTMKFFA